MEKEFCNHAGTEDDPCECNFKEKEFKGIANESIYDRLNADREFKEFNLDNIGEEHKRRKEALFEKEFNLSEKIFMQLGPTVDAIHSKDVKEFIKREYRLIIQFHKGQITFTEFMNKRNKLAGNDLISQEKDSK